MSHREEIMKLSIFSVIAFIFLLVGCSSELGPTMPSDASTQIFTGIQPDPSDHNRHLWAYGLIKVNDDHTQWDWVPLRQLEFHLNALNLLENAQCQNCVSIQKVTKLGNGLVDVDVQIKHPFPGLLKYTGFDVKGIVMFKGSLSLWATWDPKSFQDYYPVAKDHPELQPFRFNLSFIGDWELLNEDGFSYRWSPTYISGQSAPMFNYVQGKFSSGLPNSNINAYKSFFSTEERHMFLPGQAVTMTYHIQTQPGGMTMGYAVEACWEPPTVNPVTNPATDFPITANQSEPYIERYYCNDDQPITKPHTEVKEYPYYCQYKQWNTGVNQHNFAIGRYPSWFVGGKLGLDASDGPVENWLVGPLPSTDDIYQVNYPIGSINSFKPFGKYNGYYVFLRWSWYQDDPWSPTIQINFNPSIQVIQLAIPGNDP